MNVRYKKVWGRNRKIITYIWVGSIFVACNVFTLLDALATGATYEKWRIATLISSFLIECLGFLYCVVQDIVNSIKETPTSFAFDNSTKELMLCL